MSLAHYVVLRFASLFPEALARMQMHAKRTGGPLDHVEMGFQDRNRVYVGENFVADVKAEIRRMQEENLAEEVAALRAQKRKKQAAEREKQGLVSPWKTSEKGPLREVILTAHKEFFAAPADAPDKDILITYGIDADGNTVKNRLSKAKIKDFEAHGKLFFDEHFPGAVRHLRLDLDEESPHFHALILQRTEKTSKRRGTQHLIQPSANRLLKDYEYAQDVAGKVFAPLGLVRGERKAERRRNAREAGEKVPEAPRHVTPRERREARQRRILEKEQAATEILKAAETEKKTASKARYSADVRLRVADKRVKSASERLDDATQRLALVEQREATVEKKMYGITVGIAAVEERKLEYRPATPEEPEGLAFGPNAPKKERDRKTLVEAIRPAAEFLIGFARRFFHLRKREAELARRATVLARELVAASRPVMPALAEISDAVTPAFYSEASFPDAWAIPQGADPQDIQARLDAMKNRDLRRTFVANRDATLLCEDDPDLRACFRRGEQICVFEAGQRGLDLETGRHRPERAKAPDRAMLHTDSEAEPIQVKRKVRERVRAR